MNSYLSSVGFEAVVVGFVLVVVGTFTAGALSAVYPNERNSPNWNKYYVMEVALFLTGVITHLFFEFLQANAWYCKMGAACRF